MVYFSVLKRSSLPVAISTIVGPRTFRRLGVSADWCEAKPFQHSDQDSERVRNLQFGLQILCKVGI